MKAKGLGKKSVLNKKTVANLEVKANEMKKLRGGEEIASTLPRISCINFGTSGG